MAKKTIKITAQPGPQWDFLATEADICVYGGAAGGGKSYGLLLSALMYKNVPGFNCTIFRRTFKQVFSPGGLWDTAQSLYSAIPNAQMKKVAAAWEFVDNAGATVSKVTFAHIESYNSVEDWQGSQLCEICCETGTPVLMGDGTYKAVADIKVGDYVQTLNGIYPVTAVGRERIEECVEVNVDGNRQVQTADHKFLTTDGWVSYDDIIQQETDTFYCSLRSILSRYLCKSEGLCSQTCADFFSQFGDLCSGLAQSVGQTGQGRQGIDTLPLFERTVDGLLRLSNDVSTLCRSDEEHDECFRQNIRVLQRLLNSRHLGQPQECGAFQEAQGCQGSLETCACTARQGRENDSESSVLKRQELLRHVLDRLRRVLDEHVRQSLRGNGNCVSGHDESSSAQSAKQSEDYQCCYYACRDLCDECTRYLRDTFQVNVRQLDGVVLHNPIGSHSCDKDRIREDNRLALRYSHPYIGSLHFRATEDVSLYSCSISPCGARKVKPFTVSGMNHYITEYGFVNKNCFDELTHFSAATFFYMLSRNRSTCGVKPFIRATCNPDADSWVAKFIEWWVDHDTGYPIPERSGVLRWFIRRGGEIYWADTKEELWEQFSLKTAEQRDEPRSVTFIMSSIYDNKELLKVNPQYLSSLKALPEVERERLLHGNWKIKPSAGMYFKRSQVGEFIQVIPKDVITWVRCWDLAATEKDEDGDAAYTAGVLIGKRKNGRYIIADVINKQIGAADVRTLIRHTAQLDKAKYGRVRIRLPQDPGQAGKEQAQSYIKWLSGYDVTTVLESGSKESRAEPLAAQWQAGNVDVFIAPWNDPYLTQMENFPEGKYKDMVDASSNGFAEVELKSQFNVGNLL